MHKEVITIPVNGIARLQNVPSGAVLRSRNAYVASVLQTGKVIGNAPGEAKILMEIEQEVVGEITCIVRSKPPLLLNRYNRIPAAKGMLVRLADAYTYPGVTIYLEEKTAAAFEIMCSVAHAQGIWLCAKQGYRSIADQKKVVQYYTEIEGAEEAARRCAPPGYSEHHSGLALDVNGGVYKDGTAVQEEETVWAWVHDHCHEFGFMVKNLPGKEHITGTRAEPWHIRYLGDLEICRILHERQITLDEYLDELA